MMLRACVTGVWVCASLWAQLTLPPAAPPAAPPEPPKDTLGRSTPRGTVLGFLAAARKGNMAVASQYLDTRLHGAPAERLAEQLFTVLDRRLPPRLQGLSDKPEGSQSELRSDQELVGTISSSEGNAEILLERVTRGKSPPLWLFSNQTLERTPALYQEVSAVTIDTVLPPTLVNKRIAGIALFEWLGIFVGIPAIYLLTVLLNRILSPLAGSLRRALRKRTDPPNPEVVPVPLRLLLVALAINRTLSSVFLPLLARQFWTTISTLLIIAACVWFGIALNHKLARYMQRRLVRRGSLGGTSVIRLGRRAADTLAVFLGLLVALYHFGLNPTAAFAGLGVGGIAVALAAQRTLENVIGGISLIFDQVVRVGDTLKVGDTIGTVEDIGLRSTQIRTFDRTLVSVPNGQIANLSLENLSARDKFWLHPTLSLRCDTTAAQMQSILDALSRLLVKDHRVETGSIRVRFLRFGPTSLDLDIAAYVQARDWNHFMEIQGELLLLFMGRVQAAGAHIALQAPIYLTPDTAPGSNYPSYSRAIESNPHQPKDKTPQ